MLSCNTIVYTDRETEKQDLLTTSVVGKYPKAYYSHQTNYCLYVCMYKEAQKSTNTVHA
jgi:hypothetical protein